MYRMTTLVWHMITLGLLFWTSSSAERNKNIKINKAAGRDKSYEDIYYRQSKRNDHTSQSKILNAKEPYINPEKTTDQNSIKKSDVDMHFSILSSEQNNFPSYEQTISEITNADNFKNSKLIAQISNIYDDNVILEEPKNDIDSEPKQSEHNLIKETVYDFTNNDYYNQIKPTSTKFFPNNGESSDISLTKSGEENRASSRRRSLPLTKPYSVKSDTDVQILTNESLSARSSPSDRKGSSDIQDIINGFVKLLNGNVQVQVNTNGPPGKPNFPSRTRINNRGPPRITDVPPIVFDPPVQLPPSISPTASSTVSSISYNDLPPYPFDMPLSLPPQPSSVLRPFVAGIPLPEQIVPTNISNTVSLTTQSTALNESVTVKFKEPQKLDKDKPFFITSSSFIEKVNRTQIKINHLNHTTPIIIEDLLENKTQHTDIKSPESKINDKVSVDVSHYNSSFSAVDVKPTHTISSTWKSSISPSLSSEISDNILPSTGVGTAVVVLEPSTQEIPTVTDTHRVTTSTLASTNPAITSSIKKRPNQQQSNGTNGYFPRPGIVLDDLEYKPGAHRRPPPIITSSPAKVSNNRDSFDVTVSAIQGPGGSSNSSKIGHPYLYPINIEASQVDGVHSDESIITNAQAGQNFVSIDGKRTYLNLFETSSTNTEEISPTSVKNLPSTATGSFSMSTLPSIKTTSTKFPPVWRKSTHPPVRIDTCIVGDDSTCDTSQHERCRTEAGVSSCHCRPGYTRRKHREPCHRIVSLFLSLRVDRMYDQHLSWNEKLAENDSAEYQQLEYEVGKAIDSALSMTPFSDLFLGAKVNNMYTSRNSNIASPVFVNMTVQLAESQETLRAPVKQDLQKHLMGVIQRRSNNIGSSALWVDSPAGVVSQIHDVDECSNPDLNDCHSAGKCINIFGSFHCICPEGYRDPWAGNNHRSGRTCETCDSGYCNHRGECSFYNGQPICKCTGSYYGAQCEIDGEVLGVAVGSSLIAILIIVTTLACLCAWSRQWNKEQKIGSPIFGYMPSGGSTVKTPVMGAPPYQVSLEDRLRWAQIADAMAHANHYGPEPVNCPTRPSSTIFGYTLPHSSGPVIMPRLRPPSVHTLRTPESSASEEEDRADLLGRNFQVPRPKSRSSVANQSGIYYDVDYDTQQSGEIFSTVKSGQPPCIPLNTYTMGSRNHYFNFRS